MLSDAANFDRIYIACGYTDLRFGVDGLASVVRETFQVDPFQGNAIFLFCGRRTDRIKALVWEGDGFLLLYKRLEKGRFQWPKNYEDLRNITAEEFNRLISGFSIDPTIEHIKCPRSVL